jgi:hypothetical protein
MTRRLPTTILIVLAPIVLACACKAKSSTPHPAIGSALSPGDGALAVGPEARAREVLALLVKKDFDHVVATFDPTMAAALPRDKLAATWNGIVGQLGAPACDAATVTKVATSALVTLSCRFGRTALDLKITVDPSSQLSGLRIVPGEPPWSAPPYAAKDAIAKDVTVGADPWRLPGTLTLPAGHGPFPAIVLVHGSGPNNRDETVGPNRPFKDLALGLAAHGIAVLRFDKRTLVYGTKLATDHTLTVNQETVDDAVAATELLAHTPEIDAKRIFVLGHSLGGMLAPRIGERTPGVAGLVVLAGSTRPLEDMIVEQLQYVGASQDNLDKAKAAATRIHELERGTPATPDEMIEGAPASYWIDLAHYDPSAVAAKLKVRMLVLQGERDYQVTVVDYHRWQTALDHHANVTFKLYPKLDHLFRPGEGKSMPADYETASHVDEQVIHDIAAWIAGS